MGDSMKPEKKPIDEYEVETCSLCYEYTQIDGWKDKVRRIVAFEQFTEYGPND